MLKKVPEGFDFIVKAPGSVTHKRADTGADVTAFQEAVSPLAEAGRLSGILAQFPYSFKFSPRTLDYLSNCREMLNPHPLFVEFRHDGWVNRTMYDHLRAQQIGYVCVDEPQLRGLLKPDCFATTDTAYVRLHGRNAEQWWDGGALRYDYNYSEDELEYWRAKLRKIQEKVKRTYIFFNNCHEGQAAANATRFTEMMTDQS